MAKRTFKIYRYDPDKDAKPYMQTFEVELDGTSACCWTPWSNSRLSTPHCHSAAPVAKGCVDLTR
jgi:succinate dehydrogenase/fumarate reductase-like Fe-S protein